MKKNRIRIYLELMSYLVSNFFAPILKITAYSLYSKDVKQLDRKINDILFSQTYQDYSKNIEHRCLRTALIAGEDIRYLKHCGFDFSGIIRAVFMYFYRKKVQGASTIEQQLVRTIIKDYRFNVRRKIKEICLATEVSSLYNKNELIDIYIYIAYYGWRMNGFYEACSRLGFSFEHYSEHEAASLIARLRYPQPEHISASLQQKISMRKEYIISNISRVKL